MRYDLNTLLLAKFYKFMLREVSFFFFGSISPHPAYIDFTFPLVLPNAKKKKGEYSRMYFNLIDHWPDSRAFQDSLRLQYIEIR